MCDAYLAAFQQNVQNRQVLDNQACPWECHSYGMGQAQIAMGWEWDR